MITHTPVGCPHTPLGHQLTSGNMLTTWTTTRHASTAPRKAQEDAHLPKTAWPASGSIAYLVAAATLRTIWPTTIAVRQSALRTRHGLAPSERHPGPRRTTVVATTTTGLCIAQGNPTGRIMGRAVAHHHVARQQVMTRGVIRKGQTLLALENRNRVRPG